MADLLFSEIGDDTLATTFAIGRGGYNFGPLATDAWLNTNKFSMIIRSEFCEEVNKKIAFFLC